MEANPAHTGIRPPANAFLSLCPSRAVLARLGEKWSLLVLICLADEPVRFGTFRRRIEGVSQKMLTQTLRNLERDGFVSRRAYDEMPLRVEYTLTALGREFVPVALGLKTWVERNLDAIEDAQRAHGLGGNCTRRAWTGFSET